jgi:hypothetical protein
VATWLGEEPLACPLIADDDMDGVRAMYRAVIQRALHDACGATVVAPTAVQQMKFAKQAWNFLYSPVTEHRAERWFVCMLAGVDAEMLEERMRVARIPEPTYDTLKNAWTQLELAYWRLGGSVGEPPAPRPENKRTTRGVNDKKGQRGFRIGRNPTRRLSGGDRRDAGQPRAVPDTLLFGRRKPGIPVRPKYANAVFGQGASARQLKFGF